MAVLQCSGPDGLRALAPTVADPYELGLAAARTPPELLDPDEMLSRHLADPEDALASMALGYVVGRSKISGDEWAIAQLGRDELELDLDKKVALLLALPACPHIWQAAASGGKDVSLAYWRRIPQRYFSDEHLEEAVVSLVEAGRPFVAADLLAFESRVEKGVVSPETVARVLDAGGFRERRSRFAQWGLRQFRRFSSGCPGMGRLRPNTSGPARMATDAGAPPPRETTKRAALPARGRPRLLCGSRLAGLSGRDRGAEGGDPGGRAARRVRPLGTHGMEGRYPDTGTGVGSMARAFGSGSRERRRR